MYGLEAAYINYQIKVKESTKLYNLKNTLPLYSSLSTTLAPKMVPKMDEITNIQRVTFDKLDAYVLVLDGFN